jgi:hypothetical protein
VFVETIDAFLFTLLHFKTHQFYTGFHFITRACYLIIIFNCLLIPENTQQVLFTDLLFLFLCSRDRFLLFLSILLFELWFLRYWGSNFTWFVILQFSLKITKRLVEIDTKLVFKFKDVLLIWFLTFLKFLFFFNKIFHSSDGF